MDNIIKLKTNIKFAILLVFVVLVSMLVSKVEASDYYIEDYKINATILENGNMKVEEKLKYKFDENMNGLKRDILYKYNFTNQKNDMSNRSSRYQAEGIKELRTYISDNGFDNMDIATEGSESSLSNGMSGFYSVVDSKNRKNIKVYSPVTSGNYKYVKYEYEIQDVAVKYLDAGEIYWNFLGGDWETSISNVNITIDFQNPSLTGDIKVFPHTYVKDISSIIEDNVIKINAKGVSSYRAVDARVVFSSEAISGATKNIAENYNYDEMKRLEDKEAEGKSKYLLSNQIFIVIIIAAVILLIYFISKSSKIRNKGKIKKGKLEYYIEPLDKYSLGEYSTMMYMQTGYSNSDLILATILDLVNKKYLIMDAKKKLKKAMFENIDYEYNLTINKEKRLSDLNKYELVIVNYLFNDDVSEETNAENMKDQEIELNKKLKTLSANYKLISDYTKFCYKESKEVSKGFYYKPPKNLTKNAWIFALVIIVLLIINQFVISPVNLDADIVKIILGGVIGFVYTMMSLVFSYSAYSIKEEYTDEYNNMMGLKKYLEDYSKIKERYPIELVLWDKYLVFASLFGIATKVAKEFKEELMAQGYDTDHIYMTYPIINMSMNSVTINSSISSSTGSSSGGYSGGGSGGGGGRRWRWRSFLG